MPKSYLENFDSIKKRILPLAKKKKTIFSMYSLYLNDNFKIYIAETKKIGSKYIHTEHGGGFASPHPFFNYFEEVSDKIITWKHEKKKNIFTQLSPTLPIVKMKNNKPGENCSIIFCEYFKHLCKFYIGPGLDQSVNFFNEISNFVNELNPEIKSKVKFRVKNSSVLKLEKKFSKMFGARHIDKISAKNSFIKTILNSKLIISTYGQTAFSEAMFSNIPTILIIKKNDWMFTENSWHIFNILKENKMAFEDFNEAKIHIHKHWKEIDKWWKLKNVQSARKEYLANFFNVKSDWYKEWSDYVYLSTSS
jgi:putative transferase (TIGR04331 family)